MVSVSYLVRDPSNISATITESTRWAPCFGARSVVVEWKSATSAVTPQTAGSPMEFSNGSPPLAGGATIGITPGMAANPTPAVGGLTLNLTSGGQRGIILPTAANGYFVCGWVRVLITGNATNPIPDLQCTLTVTYDGDTLPPWVPTGYPKGA